MIKADNTVRRETKYIAIFCVLLSVILQVVFLLLNRWDYTVLLGNLLTFIVSVLNFYFMGITVQNALSKDESNARKLMKSSQSIRNFGIFVVIMLGVILPWFNTLAVILPVFFPRVAVSFRPLIKEKEVIDK